MTEAMNNEHTQPAKEQPVPPLPVIIKPLPDWFAMSNDDTGETRQYVDYSRGFQNTTGFLQWGKDF